MQRKIERKERGVFEKEPGSDIWWIRYYIDGRERREKVVVAAMLSNYTNLGRLMRSVA